MKKFIFRRKKDKASFKCPFCGVYPDVEKIYEDFKKKFSEFDKIAECDKEKRQEKLEKLFEDFEKPRKYECPKCGGVYDIREAVKVREFKETGMVKKFKKQIGEMENLADRRKKFVKKGVATKIIKKRSGLFGKETYSTQYLDDKGNYHEKSFDNKKDLKKWLKEKNISSYFKV